MSRQSIRIALFVVAIVTVSGGRVANAAAKVAKKAEPVPEKRVKRETYLGGHIPQTKSAIPPLPVHDPTYKETLHWQSPFAVGHGEEKEEEDLDSDGEE